MARTAIRAKIKCPTAWERLGPWPDRTRRPGEDMIAQQAAAVKKEEAAFVMGSGRSIHYAGKLTNKYGEEIDLELETLYTALDTMGGSVPAERMAEFATVLLSTQRGRQLLAEQHKQENLEELFAHLDKWLPEEGKKTATEQNQRIRRKHLILIGDEEIIAAIQKIESQGMRATCEAIAAHLPNNPDTGESYHRITVNKRLLEMREGGIKV